MDDAPRGKKDPPTIASGFYVDSRCCTSCGVPQAVAPDLVGWTDDKIPQCYWKKQPQSKGELQQAFAIFDGQELGCHRYAGSDPDIQVRVGVENCDYPIPRPESQERKWGTPPLSWAKEEPRRPGVIRRFFGVLFKS